MCGRFLNKLPAAVEIARIHKGLRATLAMAAAVERALWTLKNFVSQTSSQSS